MAESLLIRNARVLTMCDQVGMPPPTGGRRGHDLGTLGVRSGHDVLIAGGKIAQIVPTTAGAAARGDAHRDVPEIDAHGAVVMPGFVDGHTHACWAGSRMDEWDRKRAGATYLEILEAGGGIMSTVRAVQAASVGELACDLLGRLDRIVRAGTTTIEVKSGYGLDADSELKMLEAITQSGEYTPLCVVPTALLGHAILGDTQEFVHATIEQTLARVSRAYPGITIDAFCEQGAWSLADTTALLSKARQMGHRIRVHADQFNALGMLESAIAVGATSVDHLEASTPEGLSALAASATFGVMLPACGFHLDGRYARGREFLDAGGKLAIASNFNPGSAPCFSMPMIIALAVRHLGLTPVQALGAATTNAAAVLGLNDRGYLAPGARADLLVLEEDDERCVAYEFGSSPVRTIIIGGKVLD